MKKWLVIMMVVGMMMLTVPGVVNAALFEEHFTGTTGADISTLGWTKVSGSYSLLIGAAGTDKFDPASGQVASATGSCVYEKAVNLSISPGHKFEIKFQCENYTGGASSAMLKIYGTGGVARGINEDGNAVQGRNYPGYYCVYAHAETASDAQTRDGRQDIAFCSDDRVNFRIDTAPGHGINWYTESFYNAADSGEAALPVTGDFLNHPGWGFETITKIELIVSEEYSYAGCDAFDEIVISDVNIPAPSNCSGALAMGYGSSADLNSDCHVNMIDMAKFAMQWLDCVDPNNPACSHPWVSDVNNTVFVEHFTGSQGADISTLGWTNTLPAAGSIEIDSNSTNIGGLSSGTSARGYVNYSNGSVCYEKNPNLGPLGKHQMYEITWAVTNDDSYAFDNRLRLYSSNNIDVFADYGYMPPFALRSRVTDACNPGITQDGQVLDPNGADYEPRDTVNFKVTTAPLYGTHFWYANSGTGWKWTPLTQTNNVTGLAGAGLKDITKIQITMKDEWSVASPLHGPFMDEIVVREVPAPDPNNCQQALAYGWDSPADFNGDCNVNMDDLAEFVSQWLNCVDPDDSLCNHPWL